MSSTRQGATVSNCRAEVDVTRKGTLFDTGPVGLATAIWPVPGLSRSPAGICAVSVVALTKLVLSDKPFHCTMAPLTKPDPVIVTDTEGLPAGADAGDRDDIENAVVTAAVTLIGTDIQDPSMHCSRTVPGSIEPAVKFAALTVRRRFPGEATVAGAESQLAPGRTDTATDSAPLSVIDVV